MYFKKIRINTAEITPKEKGKEYVLYVNANKIGSFDLEYLETVKNALQDYGINFTNAITMDTGRYKISVTFRGGEWIYITIPDKVYEEHKNHINISF